MDGKNSTVGEVGPTLETARLALRLVRPEDAADISRLMTDAVSRWLASWPMPFTHADAVARIDDARALAVAGKAYVLGIVRRGDGRFLGTVRLTKINAPGPVAVGMGYWLGTEFHGQGYMREAARAACEAAFALFDAEQVQAQCRPENAASIAVLRGLGMEPAGETMRFVPARQREERVLHFVVRRAASGPILGA